MRAGDEEEHRLFERDPFIYFYEDFLKAYDPDDAQGPGRLLHAAAGRELHRARGRRHPEGHASRSPTAWPTTSKVTVLDFAAGTGTFLLEVMQRIFDNIGGPEAGNADPVVREHMLKNLYGFEYLIAPYTIAHLKLSQYLKDKDHPLTDDERLQVFLTNTLEPVEPQRTLLCRLSSGEVEAAQTVKEKPILVITATPPIRVTPRTRGLDHCRRRQVSEGLPGITNKPAQRKWLQDDYVKFIRFAQMKMDGGTVDVEDENGQMQSVKMDAVDQGDGAA